jgi:hypothetical protein|nr:MAG TPA: tail protein [Caudoviricetes sp.]
MMTMNNGLKTQRWEDLGLRPLYDHNNPTQTSFNHKSLHIPGRSGALDFGAEIDAKTGISIPVYALVKNEIETTQIINRFNQFFFDEFKQPRFIKTIFDYEPNKYVWLKLADNFSPNRAKLLKKFLVPFIQHDDNKYSIAEAKDIVWGSQEIDFEADYFLGNTGSGANKSKITSNTTLNPFLEGLALQPFFEINGSATNLNISCSGRVLNVGTFKNKKIEIDTENDVIYENGMESDFGLGEFYFVPRQTVSFTGSNMNFELTVHYRDIYM